MKLFDVSMNVMRFYVTFYSLYQIRHAKFDDNYDIDLPGEFDFYTF